MECLRAKKRAVHRLYVLRSAKDLSAVLEWAAGVPVEECDRRRLDDLAQGAVHQGVVLEAAPLPLRGLEDWLAYSASPDALVVILDGVEDPHNFGAIVRSACASGAGAVVFGKDRAAPLSTAAFKSAAGAMEHIDLLRVTNLPRAMARLQEAGFWLAGLEAGGERLLWELDLTGRAGLVIGSEGQGMRRLVRERCDFVARIPLQGPITSLNASVSAGIALAECLRQRAVSKG